MLKNYVGEAGVLELSVTEVSQDAEVSVRLNSSWKVKIEEVMNVREFVTDVCIVSQ